MKDKELRRIIGGRAKQRRLELGVNQPYVAEKMGVTASTIQRYEAGTIDNTKKLVLDGLADALHVSVEWLKGETEEYESDITDKKEMLIRDAMSSILSKLPYDMETSESDFSKDLLLLMLQEYELFVESFRLACRKFKGNKESAQLAKTMGFESDREYNEIMFLREITHTVNALNDMGDIVRLYSKTLMPPLQGFPIFIRGRFRFGIAGRQILCYPYFQKAFHQFRLPYLFNDYIRLKCVH